MPFAVGVMRILPRDLYRMTPGEIVAAADGYDLEQQRNQELIAWSVAHLLVPDVKKAHRPHLFKRLLDSLRGKQAGDIRKPDTISNEVAGLLPGLASEAKKKFWENVRKRRERKAGAVDG